MGKQYSHLTYESRMLIKQMLESGNSKKDIAIKLGVSLATIYRELERSNGVQTYDPESVQQSYEKMMKSKGQKSILELNPELAEYIAKLVLKENLYPSQIIDRLRADNYPTYPLSKNTIYSAIDKGIIPGVTRENLKHKKTHIFSDGLIRIPNWIREELSLKDEDDLDIDASDGKIIIKKSENRS